MQPDAPYGVPQRLPIDRYLNHSLGGSSLWHTMKNWSLPNQLERTRRQISSRCARFSILLYLLIFFGIRADSWSYQLTLSSCPAVLVSHRAVCSEEQGSNDRAQNGIQYRFARSCMDPPTASVPIGCNSAVRECNRRL